MKLKDYYKILGLETNKVTEEELKIAYREQAKKYHPDVNVGKNTEERFKDIGEAYTVLSNPVAKKRYDKIWNAKIQKARINNYKKQEKVSTKQEVIDILFGKQESNKESVKKQKKQPINGENVETEIKVSVEEAYNGNIKKLSLRTINGKNKNFEIKIPEGIRNGEKIRLIGQGKPGKDGGKNGDLLIRLVIDSSDELTIKGNDFIKVLNISPWEAVLGTKVECNLIDEIISVYVPKGIQTDEVLVIENKGYKDGKGGRGNLILQVKVKIPKKISEEEKAEYIKLKEISKFNPRLS